MKTILTIHEVEQDLSDIKPIIQLAQSAGAHLNIVVLGVTRTVPIAAAPGIPMVYYDTSNSEIIEEAKKRVDEINALLQKEDVSASVSLECRDPALVEKTVQRHAMFADITVFPNQTVLSTDLKTRAFNGALLEAGTPVIVLGSETDKMPNVKKVMYAWNSEPEASKAVGHSLDWMDEAIEAHVVLIDPDEFQQGPNPGDDIAAFLARRNLAVTVDRLPGAQREVADVLIEHANDINADMIVMGAYSHSRLREWLIGGTTRNMLEKAKIPILMAH